VGVLDRHPGLGGEQGQGPLVVGVEVLPVALLSQIEVAVHLAAGGHRSTQEAAHQRVVRREADRARVLGDVVEPQRPGVIDQHPEDAAPNRDLADRRPLGVAEARRDELGDGAVASQHPQRPIAGAGELDGQLDDALQGGGK
jgi:hypothetical protein